MGLAAGRDRVGFRGFPDPNRGQGVMASRSGSGGDIGYSAKQTQDGPSPRGWATTVFEETMITDPACHMDFRGSLRSSSKRVPNNPSSNGVGWSLGIICRVLTGFSDLAGGTECTFTIHAQYREHFGPWAAY